MGQAMATEELNLCGNLREIRRASNLTIQEVADALGYKDRKAVTTMEGKSDWLMSRIAKYVAACGGQAKLIVEVNGDIVELNL